MAQLAPMMQLRARFEDKCGHPLAGGSVFAFEVGTSTPKDTFKDANGTIPNTHPIKLDYRGEADIFLLTGRYRFVVYSCTGTKIYDVDDVGEWLGNISAVNVIDGDKDQHQINSEQALKNTELEEKITTEVEAEKLRATTAEAVIDAKVNANGVGNLAYKTYAAMDADKANIPAKSKVTVTNDSDPTKNGDYQWDGTTFTKSNYDPLTQSKAYTDTSSSNLANRIFINIPNTAFNISGYINSTGQLAASASFKSTDFIQVIESVDYKILSQVAGAANYAWYTKDKVFISAFGTDQTTLVEKTYTSPANAAYMRVCAYNTAAQAVAYIRADVPKILVIKKIIEQHTPATSSKLSLYGSSNVSDTLDAVISKQNIIITNQNNILSRLDLMSDKESPFFVNTSEFVKAVLTPTTFTAVNVVTRVSDNQITVSDATAFIVTGSCVVYDSTANTYTSHNVTGISGTTITVSPSLSANPSQVQTMHDSNQGQHLTLFGYKGLADFIFNQVQKYGYKKVENRFFNFNPTLFQRQSSSGGQITTDGTTIAIPVTRIGTAATGGFVSGTTNLIKTCDMNSGNLNIGNNAHTQYLTRSYQLTDGIAGNGFEISFNANASTGFIEIPIAVRDETYTSSSDSQSYKTSGRARLQVYNGTTVIHDQYYSPGSVTHVYVDFALADTLKVRVTCETSTPTAVLLSGIFAYSKSASTSVASYFKDGDVCAYLGDSWTQYPIATAIGETGQAYPISNMSSKYQTMYPTGVNSTGSQWLSRRLKEKLTASGKNVTMLNVGFGGQTSRWGKYWIDAILTMNPKPTHCILCFYINEALLHKDLKDNTLLI